MSDVAITIRLPEELVQQAREFGVLDDQVIVKLLEVEVERRITDFVNAEVNAVRDEKREHERDKAIQTTREILAGLDALEPAMSAQEIDEAIREAKRKT